jgi:hypothetical protein
MMLTLAILKEKERESVSEVKRDADGEYRWRGKGERERKRERTEAGITDSACAANWSLIGRFSALSSLSSSRRIAAAKQPPTAAISLT